MTGATGSLWRSELCWRTWWPVFSPYNARDKWEYDGKPIVPVYYEVQGMNLNLAKNVWRCNYCGEGSGMLALYATGYDKLDVSFLAFVYLASIAILLI